jgi:mono/diheme cytochrome c family protein
MLSQRNLIAFVIVGLACLLLAGCASPTVASPTTAPATSAPPAVAPSSGGQATATSEASGPPVPNCGKSESACTAPGAAIAQNLKGDTASGQKLFADNCVKCHGDQGKKGIDNPGSTDGTVPDLNPIDPGFSIKDRKAFAAQIDAFVEHGSTPDGPNPKNVMDSWGEKKLLTPQQIADLIAYVMSLNP